MLALSAAFDTVDHTILVGRQSHGYFGFYHTVLKWFLMFFFVLRDRTQSVIIGNTKNTRIRSSARVDTRTSLDHALYSRYSGQDLCS